MPYRNVPTAGVLDDSLAVNWSGTIVIRHRAFNVIKSPNSYAIACRAALPIRNETVTDQKLRITYGWLIDRTLSLLSVSPRRSLPLLSLSLYLSLSHIHVVCSLLFPVSVPSASLAKALIRLRPHSRFPVITISVWIANSIRPAFRSFCLSTGCVVSPFYAHLLQSVSYVRFKSYRKPCTHGIFLALNCRRTEWLEQSKLGLWRRSCTQTFYTVTFFPRTVAKLLRRT